MKPRILIIFSIVAFSIFGFMQYADAWCSENKDWSDAPCYAPYQFPSGSLDEKIKEDWMEYYDYKGEYWMEQKQYEMQQAIHNNSLEKWLELSESHHNVHQHYYLQGEAPDLNGNYVFTCNMYEDVLRYKEILKDDAVLKKFLSVFPSSTSSIVGGIDESQPPQTSILYQYEEHGVNASLLLRVFEGEDKNPCLVPRVYNLTYHNDSNVTEIRNSNFDTNEILEFLELLPFSQPGLERENNDGLKSSEGVFLLYEKQVRYNIPYVLSNGIIDDMTLFCEHGSLRIDVSLQSEHDANLDIELSRNILDPKTNGKDSRFFVLRDGEEIDYDEIPYPDYRKLSMSFTSNTDKIEIIHAFVLALKPPICNVADSPPYSYIISPLKQFKSGIPAEQIKCKTDLQKMLGYDGTPVCVTHETAPKIAERGWNRVLDLELWEENYLLIPPTDYVIKTDEGIYGSQYMVSGAIVNDISYDQNANALRILMSNSHERGILQIVIPSGLLHLPSQAPFSYYVLADREEIEYEKLSPIVLKIPFDIGTEEIEIIGAHWP